MKVSTKEQQALLNSVTESNKAAMLNAIKTGIFFIEGLECINGDVSSGSTEGETDDGEVVAIPCLFATLSEAEAEHKEMIEEYESQIKNNDRDDDDEWEGEVFRVFWDGGENIEVLNALSGEKAVLQTESWKSMAGL